MVRSFRKPLVVFTPKKLLRYPRAVSSISEMSNGNFQEVIDDSNAIASKTNKVVLCSGKFYYDLIEEYEKNSIDDIAFVRLEQLYPFPENQLKSIVNKYGKNTQYMGSRRT